MTLVAGMIIFPSAVRLLRAVVLVVVPLRIFHVSVVTAMVFMIMTFVVVVFFLGIVAAVSMVVAGVIVLHLGDVDRRTSVCLSPGRTHG
jgi:hypothetical protein